MNYELKHLELNYYAVQKYYFIDFYVTTSDSCRETHAPANYYIEHLMS